MYTRTMVFGTFDILHKGHLNFFQQARALSVNPFLIVSVARDVNVKKVKGRLPVNNQQKRLETVKKITGVDRAVLGANENYIGHIVKYKPDIIALGYDQKAYTSNLHSLLNKAGLKVKIKRLKAFFPKKYKSSFFKEKMV